MLCSHEIAVPGSLPRCIRVLVHWNTDVAQADILRAMGCDIVQGFVFAGPMFEEEFLSWTRNADRGSRSTNVA